MALREVSKRLGPSSRSTRKIWRIFSAAPLMPRSTSLANLLLLVPGYALELGFYSAVFLLFVAPGWRGRESRTAPQRTLIFMELAILPFMPFIRSGGLQTKDFAWRAAMFVQFPLLLLGSELVAALNVADRKWEHVFCVNLVQSSPRSAAFPSWHCD